MNKLLLSLNKLRQKKLMLLGIHLSVVISFMLISGVLIVIIYNKNQENNVNNKANDDLNHQVIEKNEEINNRDNTIADLEEDIYDLDQEISDLQFELENAKENASSSEENIYNEYQKIYFFQDHDSEYAAQKVADIVPFPILYLPDAETSEARFTFYAEDLYSDIEDYQGLGINIGYKKDDVSVGLLAGYWGAGGACSETWDIITEIGDFSVCKSFQTGNLEIYYSGDHGKNAEGEPLNYLFGVSDDNISKEKLDEIFRSIKIIN